eukprot:s1703_g5.t1
MVSKGSAKNVSPDAQMASETGLWKLVTGSRVGDSQQQREGEGAKVYGLPTPRRVIGPMGAWWFRSFVSLQFCSRGSL